MMELYKSTLGKKNLLSQDCLSAWGTIHWGPSLFLQAAGIDGLFPGEQGLSSSHLYHLIRLSPWVSVFSPYLSPPINQWDHIKWNSELDIPLLKSFSCREPQILNVNLWPTVMTTVTVVQAPTPIFILCNHHVSTTVASYRHSELNTLPTRNDLLIFVPG